MLKILWLCNLVLPDFSQEFGIKRSNFGGWMTAMLHELERKEGINISLCFPIYDENRLRNGACNGHNYYTFLDNINAEIYNVKLVGIFKQILEKEKPDIVHIWGTEYPHTLAMVNACEEMGLLDNVIVNIQGLVEPISLYYLDHIPKNYLDKENEHGNSLRKEQEKFKIQGIYEREALYKVKHVIGRTDWDCAWIRHINSNITYHYAGEILREEFYNIKHNWSYDACKKHTIFVSQAGYALKGFDYLLHALPDIIKDYPDVHVYVAGANPMEFDQRTGTISPYGNYLRYIMDETSLQNKITFLGQLDVQQMIKMYLSANVFVSCSRIENSPNSVCEAAVIGVPIVASFVGGIKSLAEEMTNIYLYQPGAEYMLTFYIKKIFAKDKFNVRTESVLTLMNKQRNVETTLKIYQKVRSYRAQEGPDNENCHHFIHI